MKLIFVAAAFLVLGFFAGAYMAQSAEIWPRALEIPANHKSKAPEIWIVDGQAVIMTETRRRQWRAWSRDLTTALQQRGLYEATLQRLRHGD